MASEVDTTVTSHTHNGNLLTRSGRWMLNELAAFGAFWVFSGQVLARTPMGLLHSRSLRRLLPQFFQIGTLSVPVILVTGSFVGMVLAIQAIEQFLAVGLQDRLGMIVSMSVVRELGPVLAGVMLAGRVGGALTAELGTMNVTEQLDALRSMGSDPIRVLVVPRFAACVLLTPVLTMYCDLMGVMGGWLICVPIFDLTNHDYWAATAVAIEKWDLLSGLFKSVLFGATIGLVACYKGFRCGAGAEGVGKACTESFVSGFITILILDFFIALGLKGLYEYIWGFKAIF